MAIAAKAVHRPERQRQRRGTPGKLSPQRIVDGAFALVDTQGLAGLTTRRLGALLGCEAMSIYHHFPGKRHLLDAMAEREIDGIAEPPAGLDPIARLAFLGHAIRTMARRHPRFFEVVALRCLDTPAGAALTERMLSHFRAAVPDDRLAAQAFRALRQYVIGAALDEASCRAAPDGPAPIAAGVADAAAADSTFELGFGIMLSGIAALRAKIPARQRGVPKPVVHPKR